MSKPKLVIHLDINGTIMPADPIKSKHVESMLNIHLSKQAFVKEDTNGEKVWWDGSPFHKGDKPPLLPQFRYSRHIQDHYKEGEDDIGNSHHPHPSQVQDYRNAICDGIGGDNFTQNDEPGHIYKRELLDMIKALEWRYEGIDENVVNTLTLTDGNKRMNLFVPSFLELIRHLNEEDRAFVFVIRTFGSDIPRIIPALNMIAEGVHPGLRLKGCINRPTWQGKLTRNQSSGRHHQLDIHAIESSSTNQIITGGDLILKFLNSQPSKSVIMIQDDYKDWKLNGKNPIYGKPVFLDFLTTTRHVLFDDNINMHPKDSIACVWIPTSSASHKDCREYEPIPLSTSCGIATIGTILLQANLYKSIRQEYFFVDELRKAEKRFTSLYERMMDIQPRI
jgi:hypothetical protein